MTEKTQTLLPHILAGKRENPQLTIIWMHGLGADGHDFAPIVPQCKVASKPRNFSKQTQKFLKRKKVFAFDISRVVKGGGRKGRDPIISPTT